jgi:hypothetical protein
MIRRTVYGERTLQRSQSFQDSSIKLAVWRSICAMLAIMILNYMGTVSAHAAAAGLSQPSVDSTTRAHAAANYGQVPLSFESNQSQSDPNVQFLSRGSGYSLYLMPGEAVLSLQRNNPAAGPAAGSHTTVDVSRMQLVGASPTAAVTGLDPQAGATNYLIGNDPAKWHTSIPTYGKVNFASIYPGIDLVFYGNQRQLGYDFVVKAGGDSTRIAWSFRAPSRIWERMGAWNSTHLSGRLAGRLEGRSDSFGRWAIRFLTADADQWQFPMPWEIKRSASRSAHTTIARR